MMNQLKRLMLFKLVKKDDYNTNISEIENKILDHNHGKCITTQEFI